MKPLHRSLLFWLALLPGLFLLGEWVDSFVHHTWVTSYPRGRQIAVWHYDGIVSLRLTGSKVTGIDSIIVRENAFRPDDGKPREIFPQPAYETEVKAGVGDQHRLLIPHWLLLLAWLILLLIALGVRRKFRGKRGRPLLEAPVT